MVSNKSTALGHLTSDAWFAEAERLLERGEWCAKRGDWRGAYTNHGMAVEYAIKAIYLRNRQLKQMPAHLRSAASHDIEFMAKQAGLGSEIARMSKHLRRNWLTVRDWDQERRYPNEPFPARDGKDLRIALLGNSSGVWQWLRNIYLTN